MKNLVPILRKAGILIVAIPLFIVGVAMLVLPGPGLLVIFASLFLLSLEFDQVKPYMSRIKKQMNRVTSMTKKKSNKPHSKDKS